MKIYKKKIIKYCDRVKCVGFSFLQRNIMNTFNSRILGTPIVLQILKTRYCKDIILETKVPIFAELLLSFRYIQPNHVIIFGFAGSNFRETYYMSIRVI